MAAGIIRFYNNSKCVILSQIRLEKKNDRLMNKSLNYINCKRFCS